ncbi:MAG: hypothetical protein H0X29_06845 [Parachlamydiaceae bacterium]|nr:hypothetical protein [Parachlamydiaceae bacterium]
MPLADFIKQWVADNQDKIKEIDPQLVNQNFDDQTIAFLKNMDLLPTLRDAFLISYSFDFLLTGSIGNPSQQREQVYDFSQSIKMNVENFQKTLTEWEMQTNEEGKNVPILVERNLQSSGMHYSLFGKEPIIGFGEILNEQFNYGNGWTAISLTHVEKASHLWRTRTRLKDHLDKIYTQIKLSKDRWRLDSNEILTIDPSEKLQPTVYYMDFDSLQISIQEFRELMSLSSATSMQIDQTIGYFLEHSNSLVRPTYQIFFRFLMTEANILNQRIKENPQFALEIAVFYEEMLNFAQESGEINTIIFIAGMSSRFQEVYEKLASSNPEQFQSIIKPQFLNTYEILDPLIQSEYITDEQRALAYREIVTSFRGQITLTPDEAVQVVNAYMYMHLFELPEGYRDDHDAMHDVDFVINDHFMPQLRELLQGEHRDQILSKILKMFINKEQVGEWTSPNKFPYFVSPLGDFQLNVVKGTFKTFTSAIVPFNKNLLRNRLLQEIFSDKPPKTMAQIDEYTFEMQSKDGDSYKLCGNWRDEEHLQRQFGDQWYQLQEKSFTAGLNNKALFVGNHVWYAPSAKEGTAGSMILTAKDSKKFRYRFVLENKENGQNPQVHKVIKLNEQGRDTNLILVDDMREELHTFHRLEAPEYILAWAEDGIIRQIELPRFGLSFAIKVVNSKRQGVSEDLSGYALVEGAKQHVPELGNLGHYLHLQRTESDGSLSERVIFARQPLEPYTQGSYVTNAEPNKNVGMGMSLNPQERTEYQLIKTELVPITTNEQEAIEANLFLAMTHLAERHSIDPDKEANPYARANHYLEKANNQILRQREGLSLDTLEILRWIATQDTVTNDKHPDANVLRLKAELMLLRNRLDFSDMSLSRAERDASNKKNDLPESFKKRLKVHNNLMMTLQETIQKHYIDHLTHLKYVDADLQLSPNEELRLLQNLGNGDNRLAFRFHELTHVMDMAQSVSETTSLRIITSMLGAHSHIDVNFPIQWLETLETLLDPPKAIAEKGVFLRDINAPNLFLQYYAIARGDLQGPEAVAELNEGIGLHLSPFLTQGEMLREMRTALRMTLAANDRGDHWLTMTLLAVATDPTKYPLSHTELKKEIINLKDFNESYEKLSEKIKKVKDYVESGYLNRCLERKKEARLREIFGWLTTKISKTNC